MTLPIQELQLKSTKNILMELRKLCQHPYLPVPQLEDLALSDEEQQRRLIQGSGKLMFLKLLLPKLKERGHRVLLFSQFKMALDRIEDFLIGEGVKYLRLDGDVQQATRQKDMDAFNAPGSDYFVFLLTTRAGGVGINLATADTVIVFDPDFNPHQDLQAIARSHRYGQTKPVLVFKLMTKDSVEEQIVYKGKKKMVLDHLVVQNLHTDDAEVDIDSIIMHGAKALYEREANADAGIVYNSKNVDEMINQVERQAEDEARLLDEKWKEEDDAKARGEKKEASKEARTFGFAKIWEADNTGEGQLKDADAEVEEDDRMEDDLAGARYVLAGRQRAQAAQDALPRAERLRQKRMAENGLGDVTFDDLEVEGLDLTPVKKEGRGKGKKGKGKEIKDAEASSDGEFAIPADAPSESESDGSAGEQEALLDAMGRPMIVGGMVTEQHGAAGAALKAAKRAAKITKAIEQAKAASATTPATQTGQPPTTTNAVASSSTSAPAPAAPAVKKKKDETPEEKKLRRLNAKLDRHKARLNLMGANSGIQQAALAAASHKSRPLLPAGPPQNGLGPTSAPAPGQSTTTTAAAAGPSRTGSVVVAAIIKEGASILQWLFHVLNNLGLVEELAIWAKLAHPPNEPLERKRYYDYLAKLADERLARMSQGAFFGTGKSREAVYTLIAHRAPVLPPVPAPGGAMLPYPASVGLASLQTSVAASSAPPNGGGLPATARAGPVIPNEASMQVGNGIHAPGAGAAAGPSRASLHPPPSNQIPSNTSHPAATNSQPGPSRPTALPQPPPRVPVTASAITTSTAPTISTARSSPVPIIRPAPARTLNLFASFTAVPAGSLISPRPLPPVTSNSPFDLVPTATNGNTVAPRPLATPAAAPPPTRTVSAPQIQQAIQCPVCNELGHTFLQCKQRIPISALQTLRQAASSITGDDSRKANLLRKIDKQFQLYRGAGYAVPEACDPGDEAQAGPSDPTPAAPATSDPARTSAKNGHPRQSSGSNQDEAILVDDDDDGEEAGLRVPKRAKIKHEPEHASPGPAQSQDAPTRAKRGRPPNVVICPICHGKRPHIAAHCPVVRAGTRSIKMAMDNFAPSDPLLAVLRNLYKDYAAREQANDSAQADGAISDACAFCLQGCGRSVRECADAHGGRRAIKELIRRLNEEETSDAKEQARLDALFACYQVKWPKK